MNYWNALSPDVRKELQEVLETFVPAGMTPGEPITLSGDQLRTLVAYAWHVGKAD